jgi:hypothetical protein
MPCRSAWQPNGDEGATILNLLLEIPTLSGADHSVPSSSLGHAPVDL